MVEIGVPRERITELIADLPPYVSVLTTWGVRPEFDRTGEHVYFLHRLIGDVFKVNIRTREITSVTADVFHRGIQRCHVLANGDLLLGVGDLLTGDIQRDKERLFMYVMKQDEPTKLYPLGEWFNEGAAVSRSSLRIAWTAGVGPNDQVQMRMGEIVYRDGTPYLADVRTVLSLASSEQIVHVETQDFVPPQDRQLLFTRYYGPMGDPYRNAEVCSLDLVSGEVTDLSHAPESYDEAEGVFPDGRWTMIESDRHLPAALRNKYKVDIFRMRLDGSGQVEQLADLAQRFPETHRSDNPVVDPTGRYIAYQYGFSQGGGAKGRGIFLLDLQKLEAWKKDRAAEFPP